MVENEILILFIYYMEMSACQVFLHFFLPRVFVILPYQVSYRELLSEAIKTLALWRIVLFRIFLKLFSICSSISSYILTAKNFSFSCIISKHTASSYDICVRVSFVMCRCVYVWVL